MKKCNYFQPFDLTNDAILIENRVKAQQEKDMTQSIITRLAMNE